MKKTLLAAACAVALATPAQAGFFGLGHVEPKAPPHGGWNFTSKPFLAFSVPDYDGVAVRARCRYVAPRKPYQWQFEFTNQTASPMKLHAGLVLYNNSRFATVAQIYSRVERATIRPVQIPAHSTVAMTEPGKLGCPGMQGGVTEKRRYIVAVDDVEVGSQLVRSGVFDKYDAAVNAEHREYNDRIGAVWADGLSEGFRQNALMLDRLRGNEFAY